MAPKVLDILIDFLGYQQPVRVKYRQVDFSHATFILTSNIGGQRINDMVRQSIGARENVPWIGIAGWSKT